MNNPQIFGPSPPWALGGPEWFWWITAGTLALASVLLVWWALLRDRSRGRARCPRCFYAIPDASARFTPYGEGGEFVCSECGRQVTRLGQLYKTNRHWAAAGLGVFCVLLAAWTGLMPRVRAYGVISLMPTSVLLQYDRYKVPVYPNGEVSFTGFRAGTQFGLATNELIRRDPEAKLTAEQWRLWVRSSGILDPEPGATHVGLPNSSLVVEGGRQTVKSGPPRSEAIKPGYHPTRRCRWMNRALLIVEFEEGSLEVDDRMGPFGMQVGMMISFDDRAMSEAILSRVEPEMQLPPEKRSPMPATVYIADFKSLTVGPPEMWFVGETPEEIRCRAEVIFKDGLDEPIDLGWFEVPIEVPNPE